MNQHFETMQIPIESPVPIEASYYPAVLNEKGLLIYFHGGGLIYGQRDDLPELYLKKFSQAGYSLMTLDYPLAPEMKLDAILEIITLTLDWLFTHQFAKKDKPIYLFGRSAGGYLALYQAVKHFNKQIMGVVCFYGYYTLNDANFILPNRHYLKYPKVSSVVAEKIVSDGPIVSAPINQRFPLYMAARQTGNWIDWLLPNQATASDYSLTLEEIKSINCLFLTASTKDPDVPTSQSRRMANANINSQLELVNSTDHDFDRTDIDRLGDQIYDKLIEWLSKQNELFC